MKNTIQIPYAPLSGKIFHLGLTESLPTYLYVQGYVFNMLNAIGVLLSLMRVFYMFLSPIHHSSLLIIVNLLPTAGCLFLMLSMHLRAYYTVVYSSFLLYPVLLLFVGVYSHDRGILLYLIPYMAYPFYFLHSRRKIIAVFLFVTIVLAFGLTLEVVVSKEDFAAGLTRDYGLEAISFTGAIVLMFLSLFSVKFQIWGYQKKVRKQRTELTEKNIEIETQRKKLEESNLIKDKLFSIIGHDLRTPVMGLSLLLESEGTQPTAQSLQDILPELKRELKKTAELFDNLVSWAKMQLQDNAVVNEQVNIASVTERVIETLHNKAVTKGVRIQNQLDDVEVSGDKSILEIVIRNIVSNAIKFSSKDDVIIISGAPGDHFFDIRIADNGMGITAPALQKIKGKTFYTTNGTQGEKGTGLGLIICSDLIERCGGKLQIDSKRGEGTTITISLPL